MIAFWSAFITSALVAYPAYRTLLALKSRQAISQYAPEGHQVKQGTPTMGGLIIVLGMLSGIVVAWVVAADSVKSVPSPPFRYQVGAAFVASIILLLGFALIGFIDDFVVPRLYTGKRGLGWKQKITLQIVVAVWAALIFRPGDLGLAAITVFIVLFCANAFNFLDGLDALAGSVLIAMCAGLMLLNLTWLAPSSFLPLILIGATIPFLALNAPPAKLFMGDVGSLPIGALLGLVFSQMFGLEAWKVYAPYPGSSDLGVTRALAIFLVGFILVAELVPVPLQIFWVKVFKRKLFIYTPIHHAFEKKGWPESRVVWCFFLAQIVLGALAYSVAQWPLGLR